nr:hypothetical protein [Lachnoclostridium phocaeense]
MRQYEVIETKETYKKVKKIICNKCGKEIPTEKGEPRADFLSVEKRWGYFSEKDNQVDSFDLCEECYDAFVATFVIPVGE